MLAGEGASVSGSGFVVVLLFCSCARNRGLDQEEQRQTFCSSSIWNSQMYFPTKFYIFVTTTFDLSEKLHRYVLDACFKIPSSLSLEITKFYVDIQKLKVLLCLHVVNL